MFKLPTNHASLKIKRKRAPVWPFAKKIPCEQFIGFLSKVELVKELSPPPEEWRIHPSTEARGNGFHHERRLWIRNDLNTLHIAKIRQHAQDPAKSAGRSGFEGGFVSQVNSTFAKLLRCNIRGGGSAPGGDATAGDGVSVPGHAKSHGPQPGPNRESPHVASGPKNESIGRGDATRSSPEPRGNREEQQGKEWQPNCIEKEATGRPLSWSARPSAYYSTCKWIDDPDPSTSAAAESHPGSPDLIPDSEPESTASSTHGETRSNEEDLASIPSTVQVGTPGSTDEEDEPLARPSRSPGGT